MISGLVSVVVPVFNGERFLRDCLDSIVAQDHPQVEIVVVDDGSTDASAAIAARYQTARVVRRPHQGLGATRNAGVAAATGSMIAFCDADDRLKPDKVSTQLRYLETHPEIDVVLCRHETEFDDGVGHPAWLRPDQVRGDLDGVSPTSGLFRRAVFDAVRGFPIDMGLGTDFDFLVQCRTVGLGIAVLEERLAVRRIHGNSMNDREPAGVSEMFKTVRGHLRAKP